MAKRGIIFGSHDGVCKFDRRNLVATASLGTCDSHEHVKLTHLMCEEAFGVYDFREIRSSDTRAR